MRELAREVVGEDFVEVYVKSDYETCASRDPKGLYAKAKKGEVKQFTGKDSGFEEPENPEVLLDTERLSPEESAAELLEFIRNRPGG
jgi:adenylylsulfate kinase